MEGVVLTILKVSSSDVRYHPGRLEFDRYRLIDRCRLRDRVCVCVCVCVLSLIHI